MRDAVRPSSAGMKRVMCTAGCAYMMLFIIPAVGAGPMMPEMHVMDVVMADMTYMAKYRLTALMEVTWKEFITSSTGIVIVDNGVPVEGPRRERYNDTSQRLYLPGTLGIKRLQFDDGGLYRGLISFPGGKFTLRLDFTVLDNMTCNVTDTHTVSLGDSITYACTFDYQGLWYTFKGNWSGPGVDEELQKEVAQAYFHDVTSGEYEWEIGICTISITLTATIDLNGTTRTFLYSFDGTSEYPYETGMMIVECPRGFKGENCTENEDCADSPCENDGVCSDAGATLNCECTEMFTGQFCHSPVGCSRVTCQNGADCTENSTGFFECHCNAGYNGTYCQVGTLHVDASGAADDRIVPTDRATSKGTLSNGTLSNGTLSNGMLSNGTLSNGTLSNGTLSNGTLSNGTLSKVTLSNKVKIGSAFAEKSTIDTADMWYILPFLLFLLTSGVLLLLFVLYRRRKRVAEEDDEEEEEDDSSSVFSS